MQWVCLNLNGHTEMQTRYSTEVLAEHLNIKPQTIRAALCRDGHYLGLRPIKLPNRRLLWPADAVIALLSGSAK
jgi:hypothetical protein